MSAKMLRQMKRSVWSRLAILVAATVVGVAAAFAFTMAAVAAPELQPQTPHSVQGRENCQTCHPAGSGGVKPAPASHASYTNATCLGCHPVADAAAVPAQSAPEPTKPAATQPPAASQGEPAPAPADAAPAQAAAPTGQPKPMAHAVEGRENCVLCHQVGQGISAMPADHSGRDNNSCLACHKAPAPAADTAKPADTTASAAPSPTCMDCHGDPSLSMTLADGEKLSIYVDEKEMAGSVHQGKVGCTDCHSNITGFPHQAVQVGTKRDYSIAQYEACKRCHFANYTKTLDSIHYQVMQSGNKNAPLCTDCHGAHNVTVPDEPRSKISTACGKCHNDVYQAYAQSVHGAALIKDDNKDVPVCTDCHGAHTMVDPTSASFRLDSPEMCAKCHADATMMAKYDLSPNVFKTYVQDFHGTTVTLMAKQGSDDSAPTAVCSDCHGVHDIKSVKNSSPEQIKQSMLPACQKCHPDASTNFPDAWLGHYEISPDKAPLPWLVRAWYVVLIPFMIGGLMLHIVVDVWRIARNR